MADPKKETEKPKTSGTSVAGKVSTAGNHIYFYKGVSQESVVELVKAIQETEANLLRSYANVDLQPPPLHLHIHSYGGSLFAGFAAVEAIRNCKVPVHTHIEGSAASAATIMSVVGEHRTIGAHSFMLIHQLSSMSWGKYEDLKDDMRNNTLLMETIYRLYAENTGLGKKQLKKILKRDLWFDADKCLKFGLVDEIR